MPKIVYPRSDQDRIYLLEKCISTAKAILNEDDQVLDLDYIHNIELILTPYHTLYHRLNSSAVDLLKETREKNETLSDLNFIVRDFFEVLRRRSRRKNHSEEIFTMYGLHLNGRTPKLSQQAEILAAARTILTGDKHAVQNGYSAMQNPSAQEVQECLEHAEKEFHEVGPADRILDEQQKKLRSFRIEADNLIRETATIIRFALRKSTPSNQRRVMRHYGFKYRYGKKEKIDELD